MIKEFENDGKECPVCGQRTELFIEKTGRGTEVRHTQLYDVCENSSVGVKRYYLHFNQRP